MVQQKLTKQNWPFNNPILSIILSICKRDKFLCLKMMDIPWHPQKIPKTGKNKLPFCCKTDFCNDFHLVILSRIPCSPKNLLDCNCIQTMVGHPYRVADRMQLASYIVVSHCSRISSSVLTQPGANGMIIPLIMLMVQKSCTCDVFETL